MRCEWEYGILMGMWRGKRQASFLMVISPLDQIQGPPLDVSIVSWNSDLYLGVLKKISLSGQMCSLQDKQVHTFNFCHFFIGKEDFFPQVVSSLCNK